MHLSPGEIWLLRLGLIIGRCIGGLVAFGITMALS